MEERVILNEDIEAFGRYLLTEEKAENTALKYIRDVRAFIGFVGGAVTKEAVVQFYGTVIKKRRKSPVRFDDFHPSLSFDVTFT